MKTKVAMFFLALASSCFAQRMMLDPSFGDSGRVFGKNMRYNRKIVSLPDGKILCLGEYLNNKGSMQPAILKYDNNGALDTTFNEDGILQDSIEIINSLPYQHPPHNFMSVQPDGRIYKASSTPKGHFFKTIVSCNDSNGNPIRNFGKDGVLMLDTIENLYSPFLVGFSSFSNNEIIACWNGYYKNEYAQILSKFDSTGCVDRNFGTEGKVKLSVSNFRFDNLIVLNDKGILCAGTDRNEINNGVINEKMAIIKLNPDGTFNNDFGIGGKVIIDVDPSYQNDPYFYSYLETARNIIEMEDHRLVVTVITSKNSGDYILRFMPDGSLDKSFGMNGFPEVLTDIYDIDVLKDGSMVVCNDQRYTIFSKDGIVDGSAQPKFPFSIACVAVQDDNKMLFGGTGYFDLIHIFPFIVRLTKDPTVFVSEIKSQTKVVSINPTSFSNVLTFRSDNSQIQEINMYDLNGRRVLSKSVAETSCTLNVNLAPGMYLCKIVTSKGIEYHKLVSTEGLN